MLNLSLDFNKGGALSGNQQLGNLLSNTFNNRNAPSNSFRHNGGGSIDFKNNNLLHTARSLMHDDNGGVKYQTLMSPRSKAGIYLPHLKPKMAENAASGIIFSPRITSITASGSAEGSPRLKKSIFSPVL